MYYLGPTHAVLTHHRLGDLGVAAAPNPPELPGLLSLGSPSVFRLIP